MVLVFGIYIFVHVQLCINYEKAIIVICEFSLFLYIFVYLVAVIW